MRRLVLALLLPLVLLAACGDKESPGSASSSAGGTGSSGDSSSAQALPDDFCTLVTADQIGTAIGATVTTKTGPSGDCEFTQEDARAISGSIGALSLDDLGGGYESYRSGGLSALGDPVNHDLSGIGDKAFVVTGTFPGGTNLQGAGGALVGNAVVTANVTQGSDLSEAEVTDVSSKLLALAAGAL